MTTRQKIKNIILFIRIIKTIQSIVIIILLLSLVTLRSWVIFNILTSLYFTSARSDLIELCSYFFVLCFFFYSHLNNLLFYNIPDELRWLLLRDEENPQSFYHFLNVLESHFFLFELHALFCTYVRQREPGILMFRYLVSIKIFLFLTFHRILEALRGPVWKYLLYL